jgi:hypothetical protein
MMLPVEFHSLTMRYESILESNYSGYIPVPSHEQTSY